MYLQIETDNKDVIDALLKQTLEKTELNRLYTKKLDNGCYYMEIIESGEEPAIT